MPEKFRHYKTPFKIYFSPTVKSTVKFLLQVVHILNGNNRLSVCELNVARVTDDKNAQQHRKSLFTPLLTLDNVLRLCVELLFHLKLYNDLESQLLIATFIYMKFLLLFCM